MEKFFLPFDTSSPNCLRVMTITGTFPTLIQPWLTNQLVQISRMGGDNRILSRGEQIETIPMVIREHELHLKYCCLKDNRAALATFFVQSLLRPHMIPSLVLLAKNYPSKHIKLKSRIFDLLASPVFTIKPDIIHSHIETVGYRFLNLIKANGAPLVQTFHGLPPIGIPNITEDQRIEYTKAAKAIFVNTRFAKSQYEEIGGQSDHYHIVPQGIDLKKWSFQQRDFPQAGPVKLLTVGRLHEEKGHRYVIDAVGALVEQGFDVTYDVVGPGPLAKSLAELIASRGLTEHIRLHGILIDEELKELYRQAHIFILPSLSSPEGNWEETQGVVLQEAQASGLLTIATRTGGIPEVIDDGKSGFLVPDRDSEAIKNIIIELINRANEWPKLQRAGRQWVERNYCSDKIGAKMNEIYQEIISEAGGKKR